MHLTQQLLRHKTIFVTGTDTGVGKTTVACAIARAWVAAAHDVCGMKAVASGGRVNTRGEFLCDDSKLLAADSTPRGALVYQEVTGLRIVSPLFGFARPIAPVSAAKFDGMKFDYSTLTRKLKALHSACKARKVNLLIEGAGGALVPLSTTKTVADLIATLAIPAVIVARTELGTINHTLLTVEALRARKITIAAIVLNRMKKGALSLVERASVDEIRMMAPKSIPIICNWE
ncbi:dethiobiotin synthase [Candidatus Sumerlaeota bacterium]|nr:dethiobiotin synthase [Candidatus Sumerlaeota bacterium]